MAITKRATQIKAQCSVSQKFLADKIYDFVESNSNSTTEKGNKFCQWILEFIFERSDEEIELDMNIGGKSDNSIDAWFDDGSTLYIIQTKYNTSHSYAGICQQSEDMRRLLDNSFGYVGNNTSLEEFSEILNEYKAIKENNATDIPASNTKNIEIYYITNNTLTKETEMKVEKIKEQLENAYQNVTYEIMGLKELQYSILKSLQELPDEYRSTPKKLILKNKFITQGTCIAEVPLKELAYFIDKNREYLFFSNVRNYLNSTTINKDIAKTFKVNPENFWYYNNGITILCDNFTPYKQCSDIIDIYAPQIVNGCQTASTIYKEFINIKSKEERNKKEGTILVKIIKDVNQKRKSGIIRYTNSQNTVSAMDFFALDDFHKALKERFAQLGFNYEIQRKESEFSKNINKGAFNKRYSKNNINKAYSYLFPSNFKYILPVKQIVQAYASGMHFMVINATSRSGNLAPGKEASKKLFNDTTAKHDVLTFLYPYAVMQYGKTKLAYASSKKSIENNSRRRIAQTDYKKPCLMFYVSVYFRMLVRFLRQLDIGAYSKTENDNPLNIKFEILRTIFENEKLNTILLNIADTILDTYFDDTEVKKLYQDNIPKFLKNDVEKEPAIEILNDKIDNAFNRKLSDSDYDLLFKTVNNTINLNA